MVTTSTDAESKTAIQPVELDTRARLREDAPHLRALVIRELQLNITNMTGPFSSMRQVPTFAEQFVNQFLDLLDERLNPADMPSQLEYWVARGLGSEGAYSAMDALYRQGIGYGDPSLLPALDAYRRRFTVGFEAARRAEILAEHERMQRSLYSALEKQIASERQVRVALMRRQNQLEAAADLARATGSLRDLNDLLATACRHLYERLKLSFVGIYLLDEFKQWVVLRAGAGEIGTSLLAQGFQMPLAEFSPFSLALRENRILALQNGTDVHQPFIHSLLPLTPTAVVIPLNARGTTLGFWTAHSDSPDAFDPDDYAVLTLIGDNLAYAVENAELFSRAQASLDELERAQRGYVRDVWSNQDLNTQLVYSQKQDNFVASNDDAADSAALPPTNGSAGNSQLSVPITLRGQVIGTVDLYDVTQSRTWNNNDKELASSVVEQMALAVDNARLFEATQKRAQETEIINEMARELSGELEQDRVFALVYKYLPRLMPMDAFVVWFYDEATNQVTRPVLYDLGVQYPGSFTPNPLSVRLQQVLETNAPVAINLTRAEWEEGRVEKGQIFGSNEPSASLLYVPLRVGNRIRGFMSVQTYQFDAYSGPQEALLISVSNHVATALENAQLFQETKDALQETQSLYQIGGQLNQVNSLENLVRIAAQPAFAQGAGSAQLLLMEYQGQATPTAANVIVSLVAPGDPAPLSEYTHFPMDQFALGKAMLANPRELVLIENIVTSPILDEATRQVLLASDDRAIVLMPLSVEERILGAIAIGWADEHIFGAQERRIYQALSAQLALVLNNRLLFDQTQEALAESQTLYQVSTELNEANSLQAVLDAAAAPALSTGAHFAALFAMNLDGAGRPQTLTLQAGTGPAAIKSIPVGTTIRIVGLFSRTWAENPNEPVFVRDIETDERLNETERANFRLSHVRATSIMPLYANGRWVGVLGLNWSQPHNFSDREKRLYRSVMTQAATVTDNRRLFDQTQEALAETQTLYEIGSRLNAATSIQEALEAAAGPAIVQGAYTASLLRVFTDASGEPSELELTALWPRQTEMPIPVGTRFSSEYLSGDRAWMDNPHEPMLYENLNDDPRVNEMGRATYAMNGIQATAMLPLKIGERWIGILNFNWLNPRTFSARDVRLYRALMAQAGTVLDNRSLFDQAQTALAQTQTALAQVQQAQDRLNLQYQTANILARTNSFEHAVPLLLENICASLNWQIGEYWALDENTNRLVVTHTWTKDDKPFQDFGAHSYGLSYGPGEGLSGSTWSEGRPVWVPNLSEDPRFKNSKITAKAGLLNALAFPLQTEARQFGVTVFFSDQPKEIDDTLMATMVGVGSQIGQYMERRYAEEAVRQQNTYLTALHDTTLGLMRRLNLDELLQNIITRAGELVGTEHGYVHLIEPNGQELRMRVGIGIYQDFVGTHVKPGQGLAGTVWQNEEAIVVDDYRYWQGRLPMVDRDVLRAVAGVPLKSGSQTVGVLGLASLEEGKKFGTAQIEALDRFAELAAVALDNAQLYNATQSALEQTQRVAYREKASAEIADKLYAAGDVKTVLRTAAEELRRTTGSRRATVRLNLGAQEKLAQENGSQPDNGNIKLISNKD